MTPESIYQVQVWKEHWERICSEDVTPTQSVTGILEEVEELNDLVLQDFDEKCKETAFAKEVGGETVDIIIRCLGLLHKLGLPADQMLYEKLEVMYRKYPPTAFVDYMALGMPREEAMGKLKEEWKGKGALENGASAI